MSHKDLNSYLNVLRSEKELVEISAPVNPHLEIPEIHRRVIAEGGPALLFSNVQGSTYPIATNLFGTQHRVELAFGNQIRSVINNAVEFAENLAQFSLTTNWKNLLSKHSPLRTALSLGIKSSSIRSLKKHWNVIKPPQLQSLPMLKSWPQDGGAFVTLPLVYTEHPKNGSHNLGMYRLQRFSDTSTGLHMQIGKGGGFHLAAAAQAQSSLNVNVFIGGPPALLLAAIAPLPENVPELIFASAVMGNKLRLQRHRDIPLPFPETADFVLSGYCNPKERHPEGPFGDHYGYYSLKHDFPVFQCKTMLAKPNAVYPATVVGKPRQEDYFIGDYLQEIFAPLIQFTMPSIKSLHTYGDSGFHSVAAAIVHNRYKREAMASAFRILGEGQLSLTKFLFLSDQSINLCNFKELLPCVLERFEPKTDLYVFSNLSMDTLDYTGPTLNEGSKAVMLGLGNPIRVLPQQYSDEILQGINLVNVFCAGCLVISGSAYSEEPNLPKRVTNHKGFREWPLIILCDDAEFTASNSTNFLWSTFTRFEPARDIHTHAPQHKQFHSICSIPIVIDARMKPGYPDELEPDDETTALVEQRWNEYFPTATVKAPS